ncbi:MAG TPA: PPC domain-containing protein [Candidatus Binatia bacterium]|nr:PPC domain-containing protein [Candidatus Binatia bacterium]
MVWLFLSTLTGSAAAPTLDQLWPIAVQLGRTHSVAAIGKIEPWPPKVWLDFPGIAFKPQTNSGQFVVQIAPNTPIGPHLIRLFNEQGASGPRFLIVTREPQIAEQEPNDDFTKPQVIERFPAAINGRLEKSGDVDSFAVSLEAGQTLIASLEAYTLASPVDAVLRLVDGRGVQLALNHDDGRTLDPFLAFTARTAGAYVVQVFGFAFPADSDIRFTGNSRCVYRLHLSRGPYARYSVPLGVRRGTRANLSLVGWNLGSRLSRDVEFDGTRLPQDCAWTTLRDAEFDNELTLPVSQGPEWLETEPNNAASQASHYDPPCAITGCIDPSGDQDRFAFKAKKGEKLLIEVRSASLGFPLDAWLAIEDTNGKELAKNDDSANADPVLEWTPPGDDTFIVAVGSVLHRGGADYLYRLSLQHPSPSVKAFVAENASALEPGRTNALKVTVKRLHGFQSRLTVSIQGLPHDVKADAIEVPDPGGEVSLKLAAATDAKPFSGPIQVVIREAESGAEHHAVVELVGSGVNNGVPTGFNKLVIESTDQLWLTVLPAPPAKAASEKY